MELEDHLAEHNPIVFDPDTVLSQALHSQLASTTSVTTQVLCKPFVRAGVVLSDQGLNPISFNRGLLDTGAQGINFVSSKLLHILPSSHKLACRSTDRIVRLGDARHIVVQSEIQLQISLLILLATIIRIHSGTVFSMTSVTISLLDLLT